MSWGERKAMIRRDRPGLTASALALAPQLPGHLTAAVKRILQEQLVDPSHQHQVRRALALDWTERYNTTPVLIETFVETPRYTGAVYRASGWTRVGTTQGRGRYDRERQSDKPKKDVWLRPLRRDWKRTLNR